MVDRVTGRQRSHWWEVALLGVAVGLIASCGAKTAVDGGATSADTVGADSLLTDTADALLGPDGWNDGGDVAGKDGLIDDAGTDLDSLSDATPDVNTSCPGGPDCPCVKASDCDNNNCIETPDGHRCAFSCGGDSCPANFTCTLVNQTGGDVQYLCVPKWGRICEPCDNSTLCSGALGNDKGLCIAYGGVEGSFCGTSCAADGDCPSGYGCKTATSVEGKTALQCVRNPDGQGHIQCPCDAAAKDKKLATVCSAAVVTGGYCPGVRTCSDKGLSACTSAPSAGETCDGIDNDCNGLTDDVICDDNNSCTEDQCVPATGTCTNTPNQATCSDANACTTGDVCQTGVCVGTAVSCDDLNPCTSDSCDKKLGCQHDNAAIPCDDGDKCTVADACVDGACVSGKKTTCNDKNPCTADACDLATGGCTNTVLWGNACSDNDLCTGGDACDLAGACKGDPVSCDDNNVCTNDSCAADTGCDHTPVATACEDGNPCTVGDTCKNGICAVGSAKDCDDKKACTADSCDPKSGNCVNKVLDGGPCNDGSQCTDPDACQGDVCTGKAVVCDDSNSCTSDSCDPATGCVYKQLTGPCTDGNPCTLGDTCNATFCAPGTAKDCDDNNACTTDSCDSVSGNCKNLAKTGAPCDDGNACTGPDACGGGSAANGTVCAGTTKTCDDGNLCTDDACDTTSGCSNKFNKKSCDDQDACSTGDTCFFGACLGTPINIGTACDDGNPCTVDSCDSASGCKHTPTAGLNCSDNNVCTVGDKCDATGACTAGGNVCGCTQDSDCAIKDDGDPCNGTFYCNVAQAPYLCEVKPGSVITCDTSKDGECKQTLCDPGQAKCVTANFTGKFCNADGSVCTPTDTCQAGNCVAGSVLDCDDKNPCTDDSCDPKSGCVNTANVADCEDGNPCTLGDKCNSTYCTHGTNKACNDGNLCTADKCDTVTGLCVFDPGPMNSTSCDADGNACTLGDACQDGACAAGAPKVCADSNPCTDNQCDTATGSCKFPFNSAGCNDGDLCTTGDICSSGTCAGTKTSCVDGTLCTDDSCDAATGNCVHNGVPHEGASCASEGDGSVCTLTDLCVGGVCTGSNTKSCDDGEQCTTDSCDPVLGCQNLNVAFGKACDDGDPCTYGDSCQQGPTTYTCKKFQTTNCDDNNACTIDACTSAGTGCTHDPVSAGTNPSGYCNDSNVCTTDACNGSGACAYTPLADASIVTGCDNGGTKWCVLGTCQTKGCGDHYVNASTGETCEEADGNTANCDGCESCVARNVLTLPGSGSGFGINVSAGMGSALAVEGDLTLEAWVKPTNFNSAQPIVYHAGLTNAPFWITYGLEIAQTTGALVFRHGAGAAEVVMSNTTLTANTWTHVAVVVAGRETHQPGASSTTVVGNSGAEVRFFINGTPAGKGTLTQKRMAAVGSAFLLGRRYIDETSQSWLGSVDEVHVAAAALYGAKFKPTRRVVPTAATRGLWHFDEGTGTTTADASGTAQKTAYPLALTGASWAKDSCYGAPANAGVCGDGVTASAFEECDELASTSAGGNQCDGCQDCKVRKQLFAGGSTTLTTPVFSSFAPDAFCTNCEATIEFWARLDAFPPYHEDYPGDPFGFFPPATLLNTTCDVLSLRITTDGYAAVSRLGATFSQALIGTKFITTGEWHHYALQIGFSSFGPLRLYVDGVKTIDVLPTNWDSNQSVSVGSTFPSETLMFGGYPLDSAGNVSTCLATSGETPAQLTSLFNWNGRFDDVRISAGLRYGANFVPPRRHLPDGQTRALWHLDDATSAITDDSGLGVTAVLKGWANADDQCYVKTGATAKNSRTCNDGDLAPWEWADTYNSTTQYAATFPGAPASATQMCDVTWPADGCDGIRWNSADTTLPATSTSPFTFGTNPLPGGGNTPKPWTIEGWVKLANLPLSGVGSIVAQDSITSGGSCGQTTAQAWAIQTTSDGTDASNLGVATTTYTSTARKVWRTGVWQHFALVYHGDFTGSLWVDGQKARDFVISAASWSSSCNVRIGQRENTGTNRIGGQLASLHYTNSIKYGAPFDPAQKLVKDASTVVFWDFVNNGTSTATGVNAGGANYGNIALGNATWLSSGPGCATQLP